MICRCAARRRLKVVDQDEIGMFGAVDKLHPHRDFAALAVDPDPIVGSGSVRDDLVGRCPAGEAGGLLRAAFILSTAGTASTAVTSG